MYTPPSALGGVVLAGGRSERMGTDKALLDWHGEPLVVHVARAVAAATGGRTVVVGAPGQDLPPGLDVVRDPEPHRGPLLGLIAGLEAVGTRAFVCGCDQPDAHELLGELLAADPADVVAFNAQPLGALYVPEVAAIARERLNTDASLHGLLGTVDTRWLDGAPPQLRSLNRPSDLQ